MKLRKKHEYVVRNRDGLTLVEIIITIALLGIVTALIFSFMDFGVNVFGVGSDYTNEQANLRLAAYKVTDEVRNTRYISLENASSLTGSPIYSIERTADGIIKTNHTTSETQKLSDASLSNITFEINQVPEGKRFEYELVVHLNQDERTSISTGVFLNNVMNISGVNTTGSVLYFTDPASTIGDSDYYVAEEEEEEGTTTFLVKVGSISSNVSGVVGDISIIGSNMRSEGESVGFTFSFTDNATPTISLNPGIADFEYNVASLSGSFTMPDDVITISMNLDASWKGEKTYSVDDLVLHDGNVYKCKSTSSNPEPGLPGSASVWGEVKK